MSIPGGLSWEAPPVSFLSQTHCITGEAQRLLWSWCRGIPKGVQPMPFCPVTCQHCGPFLAVHGTLGTHALCAMSRKGAEHSLPGRSGPARSGRPGGSAAGPFPTHPCGARASPAGRRPAQPLLPGPRLPGKHQPRQLRPSQQHPPPNTAARGHTRTPRGFSQCLCGNLPSCGPSPPQGIRPGALPSGLQKSQKERVP